MLVFAANMASKQKNTPLISLSFSFSFLSTSNAIVEVSTSEIGWVVL
jgi:hypothetical protein